jgi:hypothetical protein
MRISLGKQNLKLIPAQPWRSCFEIQDAVQFDNDHLYEFYLARSGRSRGADLVRFDDESEGIYTDLYPLEKGLKLFYMFDDGDSWLFQLTRNRKKPQETQAGIHYPRVVREVGEKPDQYPNQEEDEEMICSE